MKSKYVKGILLAGLILSLPNSDLSSSKIAIAVDGQRAGETSASPEKAVMLYKRLVGVSPVPEDTVFQQINSLVAQGNLLSAAQLATKQDNFFKTTLFYMAAKMSNRSESYNVMFNDFIANFIGCAREGLMTGVECNAKSLLTGNYKWIRDFDKARVEGGLADYSDPHFDTPYARNDAEYYFQRTWAEHAPDYYKAHIPDMWADMQKYNFNLNHLKKESPMRLISYYDGCDSPDFAGTDCAHDKPVADYDASPLLASRQWGQEHIIAGTNRRPIEFVFREFLCAPVTSWMDVTNPDDRVGADVSRTPAGSSQIYQTTCRGCHSGLDGLRGAFARHDWGKATIVIDLVAGIGDAPDYPSYVNMFAIDINYPGIARKLNRNPTNPVYHPRDDSWVNYATQPANMAYFGWNGATSGRGLNSFAQMVANSDRFPKCMAQRAFRETCKREATTTDVPMLDWAASEFKNDNYNLRNLFARIAIQKECLGD